MYAVFDGHGGKNAAKYAADKGTGMVAVLLKLLATQSPAFDPEAAGAERVLGEVLRQAFLKVDEEMRRGFDQVPDERSGCTAIAVLVTPTHIITANAGDSRALLSRNSQNVPLSEDHKRRVLFHMLSSPPHKNQHTQNSSRSSTTIAHC